MLANWMRASDLENLLAQYGSPHQAHFTEIVIYFPNGCKLWLDATALLLAIVNQVAHTGRMVKLRFEEEILFSYLNRLGFFELLDPLILVESQRLNPQTWTKYKGKNINLVELRTIPIEGDPEKDHTHQELVATLEKLVQFNPSGEALSNAVSLIFSELIRNIYHHSETPVVGFAALQVYQHEKKIQIVIADSGKGILQSIRPKANEDHTLYKLTDMQLVEHVFQHGFSQYGPTRGAGLMACAKKVTRYNGKLHLRLPNCSIQLAPSSDKTSIQIKHSSQGLPLIWGTHFTFEFPLDTR
jgi:hypothetical protein